jgi:cell fate regulator YaaT (PSP1 superfamily)
MTEDVLPEAPATADPDATPAAPPADVVVEVAFKGNRKEFFLWRADKPLAVRTPVIVDADRGEDLGRVHSVGDLALLRGRRTSHGFGDGWPAARILRVAAKGDVARHDELRARDESTRREAIAAVREHNLAMKVTDAEWRWDRKKVVLYFTAEQRVDFRGLVRDLATRFKARIELKQIGVRDEAKRLSGVGRCGREYCSAAWLPELKPVNLGVAKDQRLSLNPTQISGACGRLMCCLHYEHEFYVQQRKRFPKEGKILATLRGEEKVHSVDIFRERVTLRSPEGEFRTVPLAELEAELRGERPVERTAVAEPSPAEETESPPVEQREDRTRDARARAPRTRDDRLPSGDRPRGGRRERERGASAPPPPVPAPLPPQRAEAAAEQAPSDDAAAEVRRRRRRGRRGGRRHRGEGGEGGQTNSGGTDA